MIRRTIKKIVSVVPISTQGTIILVTSLYLLLQVAIPDSDLIAYSISGGLIILLVFSKLSAFLLYLVNRRHLTLQVVMPSEIFEARKPLTVTLLVRDSRLLCFGRINLRAHIGPVPVFTSTHVIDGSQTATRIIEDNFCFPHRGIWQLAFYQVSATDLFGLFSFSWRSPLNLPIEIFAPQITIDPLNLLSAEHSTGDVHYAPGPPSGDFYDLRQYNPADGSKRLLWKTYARSRQLVVRKPEQAGLPEKTIAVYVLARKTDDTVVGAYQSYLNSLLDQGMQLFFGTTGQVPDEPQVILLNSANDLYPSLHTLNATVWQEDISIDLALTSFMKALSQHAPTVNAVIIFAAEDNAIQTKVALQTMASDGLKSVLVLVPSKSAQTKQPLLTQGRKLWRLLPVLGAPHQVATPSSAIQQLAATASEFHICNFCENKATAADDNRKEFSSQMTKAFEVKGYDAR